MGGASIQPDGTGPITSQPSLRLYNRADTVYVVAGTEAAWRLGRPRTVELSDDVTF